jgi:tetratricopeptide (TPR) repeat protein
MIEERLKELTNSNRFRSKSQYNQGDYRDDEDIDNFGFSFSTYLTHEPEKFVDIVAEMENHDNWNNPSSVELMSHAYNLKDPFESFEEDSVDSDLFEKLKKAQNTFAADWLCLEADSLIQRNKRGEAFNLLQQAIQKDPLCIRAYLKSAKILIGALDYESALKIIQKLLRVDSMNEEAKDLQGRINQHLEVQSNLQPTISKLHEELKNDNSSDQSSLDSSGSSSSLHKKKKRKKKSKKKQKKEKKRKKEKN